MTCILDILEVVSMVVTCWLVAFLRSACTDIYHGIISGIGKHCDFNICEEFVHNALPSCIGATGAEALVSCRVGEGFSSLSV